ncbi:MAG: DinB family protein [Acidobacteriota bacterium]|nr:DinB family protein [Acidobacteriota bacterium]
MATSNNPEPWLRGPIPGVHPLVMPVVFSFALVREDLAKHTAGLSREALWRKIDGDSLGFHLKHIAGSVDRLTTYLGGGQLSENQLATLRQESEPDRDLDELLALINDQLSTSEQYLRSVDPATLYDRRTVGRQELPTTVIGVLVHIAEHTQRHLGQAVTISKLLR